MCRKLICLVCGVVVLVTAAGVPASAAPYIVVDNNSFERPGTIKQMCWDGELVNSTDVPGWTDGPATAGDSGVETGYVPPNGSWAGFLSTKLTDIKVWNLTNFLVGSGDVFNLQVYSRDTGNDCNRLKIILFYDVNDGTQVTMASRIVNPTTGAWTDYNLPCTASSVPASYDNQIGIRFENLTPVVPPNNAWCGIDYIRLTLRNPLYRAQSPYPAHKALYLNDSVTLTWVAGPNVPPTPSYIVYFDPNRAKVSSGNSDANKGTTSNTSYGPTSVAPGQTYYWRIDTRSGATTYRGNIWQFSVRPAKAYNPNPAHQSTLVSRTPLLSWGIGAGAVTSQKVYFDVNSGPTTLRATLLVTDPNWAPSENGLTPLALNKTYYWRVDGINGGTTTTGDVWRFTTIPIDGLGSITRQVWQNITGGNVSDLTGNARYVANNPTTTNPLYSFDAPRDINLNYGQRIHGWLYIENEANYTFWLGGDDTAQLWLGSTKIVPTTGEQIGSPGGWTPYHAFDNAANQRSAPQHLKAGGIYYIKALQKQSSNEDWLSVAWSESNNVTTATILPGRYLLPRSAYAILWATDPSPGSGATDAGRQPTLSWTAGERAAATNGHRLYFSSSFTDVNNRTVARIVRTPPNYPLPTPLTLGQTYYWRVDEANDANNHIWPGEVWSFTVADYLIVDNFEPYPTDNDLDNVWASEPPGYSITIYGDHVPNDENDTSLIHSGNHSMKIEYVGSAVQFYADTGGGTNQLPIGSDWTIAAVKALTLYFYGDPCNAVRPMYVQLNANDTGKKYYSDPNDEKIAGWHEWNIDMADFDACGVDLANVTEIALGFNAGGGGGTLYLDDIRLYIPRCVPGRAKPVGDLDNDCDVDYNDLDLLTNNWLLTGGYSVTPAAPGDANLVSRYRFEQNLNDSNGSPRNNGRDPCGVPTYKTGADACEGTYALYLDGNHPGDGNYVDVNYVEVNNVLVNDLTLVAWMKTSTNGAAADTGDRAYQGSGLIWSDVRGDANDFILSVLGKKLAFATRLSAEDTISNGDVVTGKWVHVAAVRTRSSGVVKLFINGKLDRVAIHSDTGTVNANPKIEIGANIIDRHYYKGLIDDVRFYSRALSDGEVAYLAGLRNAFTQTSLNTALVPNANLYDDGIVNLKDFAVLANNWLEEKLWP
ncbi:MAG: LamG-like jellyroll fold domain-containing protein [Sedimentisphaerales bacterium]